MIQLYKCPNCERESAAFAYDEIDDKTYCPACSPLPTNKPHDYQPIMLGGVVLEEVCCTDAGDCGHECGIA